jgi:hypothetical protein
LAETRANSCSSHVFMVSTSGWLSAWPGGSGRALIGRTAADTRLEAVEFGDLPQRRLASRWHAESRRTCAEHAPAEQSLALAAPATVQSLWQQPESRRTQANRPILFNAFDNAP